MEITNRYTLEDWRAREIEIRSIPEPVLTLELEKVLEKAFREIRSVDLNPIELVFSCIFLHQGWRVVRTPMSQNHPVQESTAVAIERATGVDDGLYGSGVPDFFLWKSTGEYRFVDIKASEGSLNENQREWAETYDWDLFVAQLAHMSDSLSDEEVAERNRIA